MTERLYGNTGANRNKDFEAIKEILNRLRSDYEKWTSSMLPDGNAPITERDIVAEIYCRLKDFCRPNSLSVHCEIKPAADESVSAEELKRLPIFDIVVLQDRNGASWMASAVTLQDKYQKGEIEARFSSVPVKYFHTAIEVKIQSDVYDATAGKGKGHVGDIDKLKQLQVSHPSCNCFFVLLNARGKPTDHERILKYAQHNGIEVIEYTRKGRQSKNLRTIDGKLSS